MPLYAFRIKFKRESKTTLNTDENLIYLPVANPEYLITLSSYDQVKSIKYSQDWILTGKGFQSHEEAQEEGDKYIERLKLTFASLLLGVDFGERHQDGAATNYALSKLEQESGHSVINDKYGVMIYDEEDPHTRLLKINFDDSDLLISSKKFQKIFDYVSNNSISIDPKERVAMDLFHGALFQVNNDTRFLMLMMAVEARLDDKPRSEAATKFLFSMIEQLKLSLSISEEEKSSLIGSLKYVIQQSISQRGRDLAKELLGNRIYGGLEASKFFTKCYGIRSNLVHGNRSALTSDELNSITGNFVKFVRDLLLPTLLDM
jgi:hypothetical protein